MKTGRRSCHLCALLLVLALCALCHYCISGNRPLNLLTLVASLSPQVLLRRPGGRGLRAEQLLRRAGGGGKGEASTSQERPNVHMEKNEGYWVGNMTVIQYQPDGSTVIRHFTNAQEFKWVADLARWEIHNFLLMPGPDDEEPKVNLQLLCQQLPIQSGGLPGLEWIDGYTDMGVFYVEPKPDQGTRCWTDDPILRGMGVGELDGRVIPGEDTLAFSIARDKAGGITELENIHVAGDARTRTAHISFGGKLRAVHVTVERRVGMPSS